MAAAGAGVIPAPGPGTWVGGSEQGPAEAAHMLHTSGLTSSAGVETLSRLCTTVLCPAQAGDGGDGLVTVGWVGGVTGASGVVTNVHQPGSRHPVAAK